MQLFPFPEFLNVWIGSDLIDPNPGSAPEDHLRPVSIYFSGSWSKMLHSDTGQLGSRQNDAALVLTGFRSKAPDTLRKVAERRLGQGPGFGQDGPDPETTHLTQEGVKCPVELHRVFLRSISCISRVNPSFLYQGGPTSPVVNSVYFSSEYPYI